MKTTKMKESRHSFAGAVNGKLVLVIAAIMVGGFLAMRVGGFDFAKDAPNQFLTKLPVLLLVALLVERTGEIFLTIWRGSAAVLMQNQLDRLTELKAAKVTRDARLGELPAKIAECEKAISGLGGAGREAEMKAKQDQKTALKTEEAELKGTKTKEDPEIDALEATNLGNGKKGTVDNRMRELADYKNQTRSTALTFNFVLSLFVAACGFRAIEGLVILHPVDPSPGSQNEIMGFRFFDIMLTAGLLAGGADPISRVMKLLRDFLDQSNRQMAQKEK